MTKLLNILISCLVIPTATLLKFDSWASISEPHTSGLHWDFIIIIVVHLEGLAYS